MGSNIDYQKENKIKDDCHKETLGKISIVDSKNNILNNSDLLINEKYKEKINNINDSFQSTLIEGLKEINSTLASLKENNNEKKKKFL
jgi:hypothetical protein